MKDVIYVIGHKNPDTDSIASAIAYANLLRKTGRKAIPTRAGNVNSETEFILDYFNIAKPLHMESLEPKVEDLKLLIQPPKITPSDPISKALKFMMETEIGILPIVDDDWGYIGQIKLSDILKDYMEALEYSLSTHKLYYYDIIDVLDGKLLHGDIKNPKTQIMGKILLDSKINIDEKRDKRDIIITGSNELLQLNAFKSGAGYIIITRDGHFSLDLKKLAEKNNSIVLEVKHDCFETIKLLNLIVPIENLMSTHKTYFFNSTDYLKNVRESMRNIDPKYQYFPVMDEHNRLYGLITRSLDYEPKNVILVDHNEISQSVKGIDKAKVIEVIDHHKLSDIQSSTPILVLCKPIGSTCTIIWERYKQENIHLNKNIAGVMLSAILSDTLLCTSPTCTDLDRVACRVLADIAEIDIEEFGPKMIEASTTTQGKSIEDLFYEDFKAFTFKNRQFCISQINTTNYEKFPRKNKLFPFLRKLCEEKNYEFAIVMLTDIVLNGSELIFSGERIQIIRNTFGIQDNSDSIFLAGIVSRKKQVVPPLLKTLSSGSE
jgi:manganese-dependent inorganic pyrophosphatase